MGTKSRLRIKPPRVRGRRRAFVHRAIRRAGRTAWQLSRSHSRHQARLEVQVDVSTFRDFPLQSPRERGTWSAFGLAVAMHAALALLLFSGVHWTGGPPAGVRVAATGGTGHPPPAPPGPPPADQPPGCRAARVH